MSANVLVQDVSYMTIKEILILGIERYLDAQGGC
jgi:hypothetical protein